MDEQARNNGFNVEFDSVLRLYREKLADLRQQEREAARLRDQGLAAAYERWFGSSIDQPSV